MPNAEMTTEQVILEVRRRYRICNRFFTAGACIWALGMLAHALTRRALWLGIAYAGLGIFFIGFGLTLAIYRCPVCNNTSAASDPINANVRTVERKFETRPGGRNGVRWVTVLVKRI